MEYEQSPYAPPKSNVEVSDSAAHELIPAGKWRRFANFVIDYIGLTLLGGLIGVLVALVFGDEGIAYMQSTPDILIGTPIFLIYYVFLESLTGRTLGKVITGTKVVNEEGLRPSFGQVVGRSFSRLIPFEAFSFLGVQGRGWHDKLARTYVVKCR